MAADVTGPAIAARGLRKVYPIYAKPVDRLKEMLFRGRRTYRQDFVALEGLDLEVPRGATVGVIGHNGSGKSTLLQLVAGVLRPTAGSVEVRGRVSALLELGAGFNPEFTGRDNVMLGGTVLGLSQAEMAARFEAIAAFADIGDFLDQPVKTYSSGMYVRLAFALAIHVDPEVLLVDEALAVGDAVFQHRCLRQIRALKERGVTILFVTHDTGMVKGMCDRAVLLERGRLVMDGDPEAVVNRYHGVVAAQLAGTAYHVDAPPAGAEPPAVAPPAPPPEAAPAPAVDLRPAAVPEPAALFRHGTGEARVDAVELIAATGQPAPAVDTGAPIAVRAHLRFPVACEPVVVGFYVKDRLGAELVGTNTAEEGLHLPAQPAGARLVLDFAFAAALRPGHYSVTVAVAYNRREPVYLDWVDQALVFEVLPGMDGRTVHGLVDLPVSVAVRAPQPAAPPGA